jgi:hypothetical protein
VCPAQWLNTSSFNRTIFYLVIGSYIYFFNTFFFSLFFLIFLFLFFAPPDSQILFIFLLLCFSFLLAYINWTNGFHCSISIHLYSVLEWVFSLTLLLLLNLTGANWAAVGDAERTRYRQIDRKWDQVCWVLGWRCTTPCFFSLLLSSFYSTSFLCFYSLSYYSFTIL